MKKTPASLQALDCSGVPTGIKIKQTLTRINFVGVESPALRTQGKSAYATSFHPCGPLWKRHSPRPQTL